MISYSNPNKKEREKVFDNYRNSIVNGNYKITRIDDSSIRVDYAIGEIERVYMIPTAITKEHYDDVLSRMSGGDKKKIKTYYVLYDEKKLADFMSRRAPGKDALSTSRREDDIPEFLSGVENGVTTGGEIKAEIKNAPHKIKED